MRIFKNKNIPVLNRERVLPAPVDDRIQVNIALKKKHYAMHLDGTLTKQYMADTVMQVQRERLGYIPNIHSPKTFNEKIAWLKLYNEDNRLTTLCDKYALKGYLLQELGEGYTLPALGAWQKAEDIDFDALPESFVLKVNWSSGFNIIVEDKAKLDVPSTVKKLNSWLAPHRNSYFQLFNAGYRDMQPMIFAEPFINTVEPLTEYKFFMNNGAFKLLLIETEDNKDFFDKHLEPLPFNHGKKPRSEQPPQLTADFKALLKLAKRLSKGYEFMRVDIIELGGRPIINELTFYPGGGIAAFSPVEYDEFVGEMFSLSVK